MWAVASTTALLLFFGACDAHYCTGDDASLDRFTKQFGSSCYHFDLDHLQTHSTAKLYCNERGKGEQLATIDSPRVNAFIYNTIKRITKANHRLWIGLDSLNEERVLKWSDGTPLEYTNFADANIDVSQRHDQMCAVMDLGNDGKWDLIPCRSNAFIRDREDRHELVCGFNPRGRQTTDRWNKGTTDSWNKGTTNPWYRRTTDRWNKGTTDSWNKGTTDSWNKKTTDKWNRGTTNPWYRRTTDRWNRGTTDSWNKVTTDRWNWGTTYPWYRRTTDSWNRGTTYPWYRQTTDRWNRGTTYPWNRQTTDGWNRGTTDAETNFIKEWKGYPGIIAFNISGISHSNLNFTFYITKD